MAPSMSEADGAGETVKLYTNAPVSLDGGSVRKTYYTGERSHSGPIRCVEVPLESVGVQTARYQSNYFLCLTERAWDEVRKHIVLKRGGDDG